MWGTGCWRVFLNTLLYHWLSAVPAYLHQSVGFLSIVLLPPQQQTACCLLLGCVGRQVAVLDSPGLASVSGQSCASGPFQCYSPPPLTSPTVAKICLVSLVGLGQERGTCFSPSGGLPLLHIGAGSWAQEVFMITYSLLTPPTPTTEQTDFASILPS